MKKLFLVLSIVLLSSNLFCAEKKIKPQEYELVCGNIDNLVSFEREVNYQLSQGWKVNGPISLSSYGNMCQALVK